ncbi:translation elongation factor Ts [Spiroplasma chrysopicola]|uniref:Elongation factor Ts n=1 Tax=Spiroplasma chrysopicola DF-1 TaxID=1276227 RepID=R4UGH0_9MOLU|nr:translation elongation factor Ts [Spiroplasma chrysopicola]AGM25215.1 elongation factor Ts [Spiroplasma chrysopicola DF-1]
MVVTAQLVKELRTATGAGMLDCKKALEETNGNIDEAIKWLREKGITKAAKKSDRIAAEGLVGMTMKGNKVVVFEVNSETDFVAKNQQFLTLLDQIGATLVNSNVSTVEEVLQLDVNGQTLDALITNAIATIGEKITLRRFTILEVNDNQSIGAYVHSNKRIVAALLFDGVISEEAGKQLAMHVSAMRPQFVSREEMSQDFLASEKAILTAEAKNDPKNVGKPDNILEKMVEGRLNKQLAEISLLDQAFVINPDQKVSDFLKANNVSVKKMIRYEVGEGIEKEQVDFAQEVMAQVRK